MHKPLVALTLLSLSLAAGCKKKASGFQLNSRVPSSGAEFSAALEQTTGSPLRPGHTVELINNGKIFDRVIESIGQAKSTIHIEMYIWRKGGASTRMLEAIRKRTTEGVTCRVLLDAVGSIDLGDELRAGFQDARCDLRVFRPLSGPDKDARNHRKVIVLDGRVGFTGGVGVDDKWLGDGQSKDHWRDSNVRVEGNAVSDMQESFAEHWQEAGGDVLPDVRQAFPEQSKSGSAPAAFVRSDAAPVVTRAERLTQLAIAAAHKRLWIENAYFVPSNAILELLGRRAKEGVDVRVLTAGKESDSKLSFLYQQHEYKQLLERGVRVWEYQPTMIHSKTMVIDDSLCIVGSVNLDPLSLNELEEGALVVEDAALAKKLAAAFEDDMTRSDEQKK